MREVTITVSCDSCGLEIEEETEGANCVSFTAHGEQREIDLCDECIYGTFLQEARPVKKAKDFVCHCGKSFVTERGLSAHKTRMAHD